MSENDDDGNSIIELGLSIAIEKSENEDIRDLIDGLKAISSGVTVKSGGDNVTQQGIDQIKKNQEMSMKKAERDSEMLSDELVQTVDRRMEEILDNQSLMRIDLFNILERVRRVNNSQLVELQRAEFYENVIQDVKSFAPEIRTVGQENAILDMFNGGDRSGGRVQAQKLFEDELVKYSKIMVRYFNRGLYAEMRDLDAYLSKLFSERFSTTDFKNVQRSISESILKESLGIPLSFGEKRGTFYFDKNKEMYISTESPRFKQLQGGYKSDAPDEIKQLKEEYGKTELSSSNEWLEKENFFGETGILTTQTGAEKTVESLQDFRSRGIKTIKKNTTLEKYLVEMGKNLLDLTGTKEQILEGMGIIEYSKDKSRWTMKDNAKVDLAGLISMIGVNEGFTGSEEQTYIDKLKQFDTSTTNIPSFRMDEGLHQLIKFKTEHKQKITSTETDIEISKALVEKIRGFSTEDEALEFITSKLVEGDYSEDAWEQTIKLIRNTDWDENIDKFLNLELARSGDTEKLLKELDLRAVNKRITKLLTLSGAGVDEDNDDIGVVKDLNIETEISERGREEYAMYMQTQLGIQLEGLIPLVTQVVDKVGPDLNKLLGILSSHGWTELIKKALEDGDL